MALVNAVVWYRVLTRTGDAVLPLRDPVHRLWTHRIAAASQALFVLGAMSWNSVRYGCYVLGSALVVCALAHYVLPLLIVQQMQQPVERQKLLWVVGIALITMCNHVVMLLSHSFTGPLSLAGAVAAYIVVHTLSVAFAVYSHRRLEPGAFALLDGGDGGSESGDLMPSPLQQKHVSLAALATNGNGHTAAVMERRFELGSAD
jgi:hypothetical protein